MNMSFTAESSEETVRHVLVSSISIRIALASPGNLVRSIIALIH